MADSEDFSDPLINEIKIHALRDELKRLYEKSKHDDTALAQLRIELDKYRLFFLNDINAIPTIDTLYKARIKSNLELIPVEILLSFLELFQLHSEIAAEIISASRGKNALKDHIKNRDAAKIKEAQSIREQQSKHKEKKAEKARKKQENETILYSSDPAENKAIIAYKKMGISIEKAREIIENMKKGAGIKI